MHRRAWNAIRWALDRTGAAAAYRLGVLGLLALALLVGSANRATAGNPGDLILNEFNATADAFFLKRRDVSFLDANVAVADDEINIVDHLMPDLLGPNRLTTLAGTLPAGLSLGVDYYIVTSGLTNSPASDWFGLSLTPGGAKVDITGAAGGGTHKLTQPQTGDPFFGIVQGNGGNWLEVVVITDHLDIRGWTLDWRNADPDAGRVIFKDIPFWSDLRSGTIITVREDDLGPPGYGVLLTDLSYDPQNGDWWIHVNVDDLTVVSQFGFKVDDDNWQMRILDGSLTIIQDWVGESTALWGGTGGVAGNELGKLEEDPSAAVASLGPPLPNYNDGIASTFGSENRWMSASLSQDFCALRDPVLGNPICGLFAPSVPGLAVPGGLLLTGLIAAVGCALSRRRR